MKRFTLAGTLAVMLTAAIGLASAQRTSAETPPKPLPRVVVYVMSQNLCYDSVVTAQNLPDGGPFQPLMPGGPCGPGTFTTTVGPGDPGDVGGRWITPTGSRFSCPLIGPGFPPPTP